MEKEAKQPTLSEAFSTPRDSTGLGLENVKGIKVGETLITPQRILADAEKLKGRTFITILCSNILNEVDLIRMLAYEKLPFRITGDRSACEPVTLRAEVGRFPFKINGEEGFERYTVRLMPEKGERIEKVELNEDCGRIIVNEMTMTPERVSMKLGHGTIRAEVKFSHQENLPPLESPKAR